MATYKQNNLGEHHCTCPSHSNSSVIQIPASPSYSSSDSFPFANSFNNTNPNLSLVQTREQESRFQQKPTSTSSRSNTAVSPTTQSDSHSDLYSHRSVSSPSLAKLIIEPLVKFARRVSYIFSFSSHKATAENEGNVNRTSNKREKIRNAFTARREDFVLNLPRSIRPDISEIDYLRRVQRENGESVERGGYDASCEFWDQGSTEANQEAYVDGVIGAVEWWDGGGERTVSERLQRY